MPKPTVAFPGSHRTSQAIGLSRGKACSDHRQFDDLFLEDRHSQRALEHLTDCFAGVSDLLFTVTPPQVGMHHVALDRARPDDGNLDDQIIKTAWP